MKVSSICVFLLVGVFASIPIKSDEPMVIEPIETSIITEAPIVAEDDIVVEQCCIPAEDETTFNKWGIELTDDEIDMLAKIVFLEAHTQSEKGILAVIEVIFNRMISDSFPDTLEGVLSQSKPCVQFTTWKNLHIAKPTEKEYSMIYAALNGEQEVLTTEYVYFARGKQNNNDPIQIEDHWFCKE